jgi:hypothetical protein
VRCCVEVLGPEATLLGITSTGRNFFLTHMIISNLFRIVLIKLNESDRLSMLIPFSTGFAKEIAWN